jgi:hypothetical protein
MWTPLILVAVVFFIREKVSIAVPINFALIVHGQIYPAVLLPIDVRTVLAGTGLLSARFAGL